MVPKGLMRRIVPRASAAGNSGEAILTYSPAS
jgi:hypothetical protein